LWFMFRKNLAKKNTQGRVAFLNAPAWIIASAAVRGKFLFYRELITNQIT